MCPWCLFVNDPWNNRLPVDQQSVLKYPDSKLCVCWVFLKWCYQVEILSRTVCSSIVQQNIKAKNSLSQLQFKYGNSNLYKQKISNSILELISKSTIEHAESTVSYKNMAIDLVAISSAEDVQPFIHHNLAIIFLCIYLNIVNIPNIDNLC